MTTVPLGGKGLKNRSSFRHQRVVAAAFHLNVLGAAVFSRLAGGV